MLKNYQTAFAKFWRKKNKSRRRSPEKLAERVAGNEPTTRETEVLELMATGKTNREFAAGLFVSEGTVKFHVNNILSKLRIANR